MIKLGGKYRYRVGNFVMSVKFEIISRKDDHWVGRSLDEFETYWYFNDNGQQIGTQESGINGKLINVWLVL